MLHTAQKKIIFSVIYQNTKADDKKKKNDDMFNYLSQFSKVTS